MRLLLLLCTLAACGGGEAKPDAAMTLRDLNDEPDIATNACSFAPTACTGQQTGQSCIAGSTCSLCDGADPYVCTCVDLVWQCQNGAVSFDMAYYGDGGV